MQVALVIAKIARSDYPREWPTLVSDLMARVQGGSTLTVRCVLAQKWGGTRCLLARMLALPVAREGVVKPSMTGRTQALTALF